MTLIASIVGTLVLIGVVVIALFAFTGNDSKPNKIASGGGGGGSTSPAAQSPSASPTPTPTKYPPAKGASVSYTGVNVKGATDLKGFPGVTSKGSGDRRVTPRSTAAMSSP